MHQHEPTETAVAQVKALAAHGVSQDAIASYVGIAPKTLRLHYRELLAAGRESTHRQVTEFLVHAATGKAMADGASHADCLRAGMFYAKTQMGWRETEVLDMEETAPRRLVVVTTQAASD